MTALGHDMRDVELVEDDGAPHAAARRRVAAPTAPSSPTPATAVTPSTSHPLLVAVAVLVIGLVLGDVAGDARARAGLAVLSGVEGVVSPLDAPVTELWRAHPDLRPELGEAGGLLVGVTGSRGAADVVGLHPATGAVVWRTVVREPGPDDGGAGVRCVTPGPSDEAGSAATRVSTVVCVVDRAATTAEATGSRPTAGDDRLLTLDARTGALLAERTVERSTVLTAIGPDVVVGHVDPAGHVHVRRVDPLGDQVRWTFVSPRPLPRSHLAWATRIGVQDGVVVIDEADGWALSGDGGVLHSWSGRPAEQPAGSAQVVAAGRFLARPGPTTGRSPRSLMTDLEAGRSFVVEGRPLPTWPDDGTADGRLLVQTGESGGLVAYDPSGARRWSVPGSVQGRALVVDGRLLRIGQAELSAIDVRTGTVLWSTSLTRTARTSLLTDGRLAVVTRLDPDDRVVLTAYGLEDGRPRWTVDLADDVSAVTAFGDRLFGWTGERLVALGRPGG